MEEAASKHTDQLKAMDSKLNSILTETLDKKSKTLISTKLLSLDVRSQTLLASMTR